MCVCVSHGAVSACQSVWSGWEDSAVIARYVVFLWGKPQAWGPECYTQQFFHSVLGGGSATIIFPPWNLLYYSVYRSATEAQLSIAHIT